MATLQNTSTSTKARNTGAVRSRPMPWPIVAGTARSERPSRSAREPRVGVRSSRTRTVTNTRWTTWPARANRNGSSSGLVAASGAQATRAPDPTAPTAIARPSTVAARARARLHRHLPDRRPGRCRRTRPPAVRSRVPGRLPAGPMASTTTQKDCADTKITIATMLITPAAIRTGRRPIASARLPVGSSRASTTNPCAAKTMPTWVRLRSRSSINSTLSPMVNPTGNQRVAGQQQQPALRRRGGHGRPGHRPVPSGGDSGSSGRA